jgi:hypothetical protein
MKSSRFTVFSSTLFAVLGQSAAAFAADCYVDSVGGSDTNNGSSETSAVKSIAKIPSSCTVIKFKRGSEFKIASGTKNLGIAALSSYSSSVTSITNYGDASQPLPKFVKDHVDGSGGMIQSFGAISIDGLYLAGSKSANSMGQLADGIGVMLGANSVLKNSEITLCDIGIMTSGDNVKVLNNYVHDLSISVDAAPGVDPNAVGGAEGIFVNSSHVEVAYNRFVNCSTAAQWVSNTNGGGVRCDGGATEVTVPYAGEVTDVNIHHNFSYNSCGFFEVSSMFQSSGSSGAYVKGKFTNSVFHDNVMIDSGWISLLQVNNTRLINVRWENNTIVHHDMGTTAGADGSTINLNDFGSSAIQAIAFNTTSSGVTGGGEISPGDIFWTNNLWYFDPKVKPYNLVDPTHKGSDALLANITVTGDVVVTTNPGFKDITSKSDPAAYDLVSGSLAIDKGTNIAEITSDFLNRPRPAGAALDLGAFEYQPNAGGASSTSTGGTSATSTGSSAPDAGGQTASTTSDAGGQSTGTTGPSNPAEGGAATATSAANGSAVAEPAGCGCTVPGNSSPAPSALLMAASAWLLGRGRRRR